MFVSVFSGDDWGMPVSTIIGGLLLSAQLLLLSNLLSHLVGYSLIQCYALGNIDQYMIWPLMRGG